MTPQILLVSRTCFSKLPLLKKEVVSRRRSQFHFASISFYKTNFYVELCGEFFTLTSVLTLITVILGGELLFRVP